MNDAFSKGFEKMAKISLKTPSFGKSLRGSAFAKPSKTVTPPKTNFGLTKGNARKGYRAGGTANIQTNMY